MDFISFDQGKEKPAEFTTEITHNPNYLSSNYSDIVEFVQKKLKKASAHWCCQSCVKTLAPIIFHVLTHAGGGLTCPATLRHLTPLFLFFFPRENSCFVKLNNCGLFAAFKTANIQIINIVYFFKIINNSNRQLTSAKLCFVCRQVDAALFFWWLATSVGTLGSPSELVP